MFSPEKPWPKDMVVLHLPDSMSQHASFLQTFFSHMLFKLNINRDRPMFDSDMRVLLEKLNEETSELMSSAAKGKQQDALDEGADVANVAMIIAGVMCSVHARHLPDVQEEAKPEAPIVHSQFKALRNLRTVPRWTIVPHLRPQNVAEHTFYTLCILIWLDDQFKIGLTAEDFKRVIVHDAHEAFSGDVPTTAKPEPTSDSLAAMSAFELWLKVADLLEAHLFLAEENMVGNRHVGEVRKFNIVRGQLYIRELQERKGSIASPPNYAYLCEKLVMAAGY